MNRRSFFTKSIVLGSTLKNVPISRHNIGNYQNTIYALSLCNIHDAWLNAIDI